MSYRVEQPEAHCDWLKVIIDYHNNEESQYISTMLGFLLPMFPELGTGKRIFDGRDWHMAVKSQSKSTFAVALPTAHTYGAYMVDLSGQEMSRMGSKAHRDIIETTYLLGGRCTRIDLAVDLPRHQATWPHLQEIAWQVENHYAVQKKWRVIRGDDDSVTIYLGRGQQRRGGVVAEHSPDRIYRMYDKYLESGGLIDSIRIEQEQHRERAQATYCEMAMWCRGDIHDEGWAGLVATLALQGLDFRCPGEQRRARRRIPPPWSTLQDYQGWACSVTHRKPSGVPSCLAWMARCVLPKLELYREAYGEPWLADQFRTMRQELTYIPDDIRLNQVKKLRVEYPQWSLVHPQSEVLTGIQ